MKIDDENFIYFENFKMKCFFMLGDGIDVLFIVE